MKTFGFRPTGDECTTETNKILWIIKSPLSSANRLSLIGGRGMPNAVVSDCSQRISKPSSIDSKFIVGF